MLLSVLFTASVSAREVPRVSAPQQEEKDPDVKKGDPKDLISMGIHLQDLIIEEEGKENKVAGLDFFIDRLQAGIRTTGNDVPRNDILENAAKARAELKDSYNGLKEAVTFLLEARDILMKVEEDLLPAVKMNFENSQQVQGVVDKMVEAVAGMKSDPPDSKGIKIDHARLFNLENPGYLLDPLPERIQQAAEKTAQAKIYLDAVKTMHGRIQTLKRKAAELDAVVYERLSERKTALQSEAVPSDSRSEMVIANANEWLKKTADKAGKIQEALEGLSRQSEGLEKAVSDAQKTNLQVLEARDKAVQNAPKIEKEDRRILTEFKPPYPGAVEEVKKQLAAEAEGSAKRAKCARCEALKLAAAATEARTSSIESYQQAKTDLKKLLKDVGERKKDDLTDIVGSKRIDVPAPQGQRQAGRSAPGAMKKSQPVPPDFRRGLEADGSKDVLLRQLSQ
ncbi:MAG TPA: hypothetical protein DCM05_10210 [Elusimicrobia bacterium]|nr:hypothetical protein [Elusimicrobiota bacterium]